MRWLAVYDGLNEGQALQNLQVILQESNSFVSSKASKAKKNYPPEIIQLEICVLQLLVEEFPLDEYLGEMERATLHDVARVEQFLQDHSPDLARVRPIIKILRGPEKEASALIATEAKTFKAERIYLPLGDTCWKCQSPRSTLQQPRKSLLATVSGWFKGKSPKAQTPNLEIPEYQPGAVTVANLLAVAPCPVYPTCHGEVVFSLQMQRSTASSVAEGQQSENFKTYEQ